MRENKNEFDEKRNHRLFGDKIVMDNEETDKKRTGKFLSKFQSECIDIDTNLHDRLNRQRHFRNKN